MQAFSFIGAAAAALLALAGCTASRDADPTSDVTQGGTLADDDRSWTASPRGIGPIRAGMSVDEAREALGAPLGDPVGPDPSCGHAPIPGAPGSVMAMIVDGRIVRIEVRDSSVVTRRGARVGDSEARIDSLYAGQVSVEPHAYTNGHYLVVTPESPADSMYRLIFETDRGRVTEYRAGLLPQVAWIEGCA